MKFTAILMIDVDLNGVDAEEIKAALESGIRRMFGEGAVTGDSDAEVDSWDVKVESWDIKESEEPEPPKGGCYICGHDH